MPALLLYPIKKALASTRDARTNDLVAAWFHPHFAQGSTAPFSAPPQWGVGQGRGSTLRRSLLLVTGRPWRVGAGGPHGVPSRGGYRAGPCARGRSQSVTAHSCCASLRGYVPLGDSSCSFAVYHRGPKIARGDIAHASGSPTSFRCMIEVSREWCEQLAGSRRGASR